MVRKSRHARCKASNLKPYSLHAPETPHPAKTAFNRAVRISFLFEAPESRNWREQDSKFKAFTSQFCLKAFTGLFCLESLCGSYYNILKAILYLLMGTIKP